MTKRQKPTRLRPSEALAGGGGRYRFAEVRPEARDSQDAHAMSPDFAEPHACGRCGYLRCGCEPRKAPTLPPEPSKSGDGLVWEEVASVVEWAPQPVMGTTTEGRQWKTPQWAALGIQVGDTLGFAKETGWRVLGHNGEVFS